MRTLNAFSEEQRRVCAASVSKRANDQSHHRERHDKDGPFALDPQSVVTIWSKPPSG